MRNIQDRPSPFLAERVAEAKAPTFEQAAQAYIRAHRAGWKSPKSLVSCEHTLSAFAYPVIGKLPVDAIDTDLVMKVLDQEITDGPDGKPASLWSARPETASRLRGRIESIPRLRSGDRPAPRRKSGAGRGHLDHLLPARQAVAKTVHHPALPYPEIADFMAELRARDGIAARALEFTVLTVARTGETIGATWGEINLEARLWTIPGTRMKAGKEHRVPLANAALAVLTGLTREGARVFPVSNMAMTMLLRRMVGTTSRCMASVARSAIGVPS